LVNDTKQYWSLIPAYNQNCDLKQTGTTCATSNFIWPKCNDIEGLQYCSGSYNCDTSEWKQSVTYGFVYGENTWFYPLLYHYNESAHCEKITYRVTPEIYYKLEYNHPAGQGQIMRQACVKAPGSIYYGRAVFREMRDINGDLFDYYPTYWNFTMTLKYYTPQRSSFDSSEYGLPTDKIEPLGDDEIFTESEAPDHSPEPPVQSSETEPQNSEHSSEPEQQNPEQSSENEPQNTEQSSENEPQNTEQSTQQ